MTFLLKNAIFKKPRVIDAMVLEAVTQMNARRIRAIEKGGSYTSITAWTIRRLIIDQCGENVAVAPTIGQVRSSLVRLREKRLVMGYSGHGHGEVTWRLPDEKD